MKITKYTIKMRKRSEKLAKSCDIWLKYCLKYCMNNPDLRKSH